MNYGLADIFIPDTWSEVAFEVAGMGLAKVAVAGGKIYANLGADVVEVVRDGKGGLKAASPQTVGAPNRTATQADVADHFQQDRQFWTQDPIQFNGNKVFQRNDLIDPSKVDPKTGKTNLELMQAGRAPLGPDGKPVNLHHLTQKQDGAIAEVTQTLHKDNHGTLHTPNTVPSGINRTEFNMWRRNYWKNRANDF